MPHPFGSRTRDEVRALASECARELMRIVSTHDKAGTEANLTSSGDRVRLIEAPQEQEEFDAWCRERNLSDGLPLLRPTQERVERFVRAAGRASWLGVSRRHSVPPRSSASPPTLRWRAVIRATLTGTDQHLRQEVLRRRFEFTILASEHAQVLHRAGPTKAQVKRRLWEQSKLSVARRRHSCRLA